MHHYGLHFICICLCRFSVGHHLFLPCPHGGRPPTSCWFPRIYLCGNIFHFRIPGNMFCNELVSKKKWWDHCVCSQ
jgi:hypothetical protein